MAGVISMNPSTLLLNFTIVRLFIYLLYTTHFKTKLPFQMLKLFCWKLHAHFFLRKNHPLPKCWCYFNKQTFFAQQKYLAKLTWYCTGQSFSYLSPKFDLPVFLCGEHSYIWEFFLGRLFCSAYKILLYHIYSHQLKEYRSFQRYTNIC